MSSKLKQQITELFQQQERKLDHVIIKEHFIMVVSNTEMFMIPFFMKKNSNGSFKHPTEYGFGNWMQVPKLPALKGGTNEEIIDKISNLIK